MAGIGPQFYQKLEGVVDLCDQHLFQGIGYVAVDPGMPVRHGRSFCSFCRVRLEDGRSMHQCRRSILQAAQLALHTGEPSYTICWLGLSSFVVPVAPRGVLLGAITVGGYVFSEDQKDLVQEIILQLWSSYGNYDPKYKYTTWAYRIALNVSITHYRKDVVRKKHTIPMSEQLIESSPEESNAKTEDIQLLRTFIQELNELDRALMILYLDGNSHQEISSVLNISASNVGTKINRIKEKLKEKFD